MAKMGLCIHSETEISKNQEWIRFIQSTEYNKFLEEYKANRTSENSEKLRQLSYEYNNLMIQKYGRVIVMLGPEEDMYDSPYCKECLLEYIKEIEEYESKT